MKLQRIVLHLGIDIILIIERHYFYYMKIYFRKCLTVFEIFSFENYYVYGTFIVSTIIGSLQSMKPSCYSLPINALLPSKTFLRMRRFFLFLCLFRSFSSHTFSWTCGSLREPRKFFQTLFLCIHFFV